MDGIPLFSPLRIGKTTIILFSSECHLIKKKHLVLTWGYVYWFEREGEKRREREEGRRGGERDTDRQTDRQRDRH